MTSKVTINGRQYPTELVDVAEAARPWADFLLSDGTRLRVHVVIDAVQRLSNEYDPNGKPLYHVRAKTVHVVEPPPELCKEPG